jgi:hypothetical protein
MQNTTAVALSRAELDLASTGPLPRLGLGVSDQARAGQIPSPTPGAQLTRTWKTMRAGCRIRYVLSAHSPPGASRAT